MEAYGINWALFSAQLVNLGLLLAWLALAFVALRRLRRARLSEAERLGWAALILLVPLLGALALLLVAPGRERSA